VDGVDSTQLIIRQTDYLPWKFDVEEKDLMWIGLAHSNSEYDKIGFSSLETKKKQIRIITYACTWIPVGPIGINNTEFYWDIRKLTNKHFWLETTYNGKKYELQLYKLQD
jgi:hypothetical protein